MNILIIGASGFIGKNLLLNIPKSWRVFGTYNSNKNFQLIHNYYLFGIIPMPVIYLFLVASISYFLLNKCSIGRYIYAVGSNEEAACLSGINISRTKLIVYGFSGLMCGISGIILLSRLNSGQPGVGVMYELDAIAAAIIGGTSLSGGEGSIVGTIIGALILGVLRNIMNLLGFNVFYQYIASGIVLIFAVILDAYLKGKGVNKDSLRQIFKG